MNTFEFSVAQALSRLTRPKLARLGILLAALCTVSSAQAQGTTTISFEGLPRGVRGGIGVYTESGMQFGNLTPQTLVLSGGGVAGYPDNGTGYLEIPAGTLRFGFHEFPPTFPATLFNFVSFDAAEYASFPPATLTVVGYHLMAGTVTNTFVLDGINDGTGPLQDFQTFHLDSSFENVFRVDVFNASWSLDNLVISGVPEPSAAALVVLGTVCAVGYKRRTRRTAVTK